MAKAADLSAASGSRYRSLDHWRGFAALWVLVFHANRGEADLAPGWLGWFVSQGWLGVHVFFVISGYCIAERTAREIARQGSALHFMADRLLRIYPPYWAALGVTLVLNVAGALVKGTSPWAPLVLPAGWTGTALALMAVEPWFGQAAYLFVAWTLSYEIGFYICVAPSIALAVRTGWLAAGLFWWTLLLVASFLPVLHPFAPLITLWPHFVLGAIVWLAAQGAAPAWLRLLRGTALVALMWFVASLLPPDLASTLRFCCGCAWLLVWLRPCDDWLARTPFLSWLGWTGTFSYSLYLVHAPIVGKLRNLLERWPPLTHQAHLLVAFSCLISVLCARLFYRAIELRCETFRHRRQFAASPRPGV